MAVKEAIGDLSDFEEDTFKIGVEFDHMSIQTSEKLKHLYPEKGKDIMVFHEK